MEHKGLNDTPNHYDAQTGKNRYRYDMGNHCEELTCEELAIVKCEICGRYFCEKHIVEHLEDVHGVNLTK